ncbi:GMC family oxidoreductase N-terminal domain-containing protein [Pseudomonas sp. PDM24]|uniref:GMC family oxidoreductase n=1 Tax=Pseudomonas sp. PDM24 TaxID=2854777 RepID=UPI001C458E8E|nr:GMC family oxidoreductase N-terminal domain-containing protein [Pseudomonas sp. PDM24]
MEKYDYIIVGGGSAGCVLANRLSQDPGCRVLLLEAGGDATSLKVRLAFGFALMLNKPRYDWCYETQKEPHLNDRQMPYPRGKLLGGSSSINAMLYVRGLKEDYDAWAAEGLDSWGWAGVEPYLNKLEHYQGQSPWQRGNTGPVKVNPVPNFHPLSARIVEAAGQSSVGSTQDYNGTQASGIGQAQVFYHDGRRCGSAAAYLEPVLERANLRVETNATVERVLFKGQQATGVQYRQNSEIRLAEGREVILSAGAIGSPQLLELSGIGQTARLRDLGIEMVKDLPAVGEYLQDHFLVFVVQALQNIRGMGAELSGWRAALNTANYLLFKRGHMNGTPTQICGHGSVKVDGEEVGLQFMGMPLSFVRDPVRKTVVQNPDAAMMLGMNVCRPHSRGHVHIRSNKVDEAPEIATNFLSDERDLKATIAGLRLCREIIAQQALDGIRAEETAPGCQVDSDEALTAYIRAAGASAYHPVGTCRMGVDPATSVVDAQLRVHGLKGLRVVDASVMPRLVSANTHAPTVMIAEKAADLIRGEHSRAST